jgi:hypothetical protein
MENPDENAHHDIFVFGFGRQSLHALRRQRRSTALPENVEERSSQPFDKLRTGSDDSTSGMQALVQVDDFSPVRAFLPDFCPISQLQGFDFPPVTKIYPK